MRVAASATECASVASVLRPCPVANTRVRADSLGGTSTTLLTVGDQPAGDVPADALASLNRPGPLRPAPHRPAHRPVPGHVSAIPPATQHSLVRGP